MQETNVIPLFKTPTLRKEESKLCLIPFTSEKETLREALSLHEKTGFLAFLPITSLLKPEGSYRDFCDLSFSALYLPHWEKAEIWQKNQIKDFIASLRGSSSPRIIIGVNKVNQWNIF